MIQLEINRKQYNYRIPWATERTRTSKEGLAISGKRILTTADDMDGHTLVRVQKNADGKWWQAKVTWVSYPTNLALLEVDDASFWEGVPAARLSDQIPQEGDAQVFRWNQGRVEKWSAEINKVIVGAGQMSFVQHLQLNVDSKINGAGWAEIVVRDGEVVGLTTSATDDNLKVMPTAFVKRILEARESGEFTGLGFFDFGWQAAVNETTTEAFGLPEGKEGVLVTQTGLRTGKESVLQSRDIILEMDGFSITREGLYEDPEFGRLPLTNLATRNHFASDSVEMVVWREGEEVSLTYELPEVVYQSEQVPDSVFDKDPEYLVAGGLLFMPLTGPYLATFGRSQPFLFDYYSNTDVESDRDGLIVIAAVLPDPYTIGYDSLAGSLVDEINGRKIESLADVLLAFRSPPNGFHELQFFPEHTVTKAVVDVGRLEAATARVLLRYSIPAEYVIHDQSRLEQAEKEAKLVSTQLR